MTSAADYEGQDLRGRSFEGQDLDEANFAEADLRGADFSNASLVGADFTNARLGVRPLVALVILMSALVVSVTAGVAVGLIAEATRERATSSDWRDVFAGVLLASVIGLFLGLLFAKGASVALRSFMIVVVGIVIVDFAVVYALSGELRFKTGIPLIGLLFLFAPAAIAGILGRMVGGTFGAWAITLVAAIGGVAAGRAHGGLAAIAVSVILVLISKRALRGDDRDGPMRNLGHRIVTHRGTRFTEADVSGADFTGTALTHTPICLQRSSMVRSGNPVKRPTTSTIRPDHV